MKSVPTRAKDQLSGNRSGEGSDCSAARQDVTRHPIGFLLWYGLPVALILVSGDLFKQPALIGLAWAGAFAVMGGKCFVNASQCGRVHCYFTGPLLLLAALASLLHGFEVLPPGWLTWDRIGYGALIGSAVFWCGSEIILGRYRHSG